jgi:hypothetical protein
MRDTELDEIERLAKAATPGPWASQKWRGEDRGIGIIAECEDVPTGGTPTRGIVAWVGQWFRSKAQVIADAAYVARMNPTTILALVAEVRTARVLREAVEWLWRVDNQDEAHEAQAAVSAALAAYRAATGGEG